MARKNEGDSKCSCKDVGQKAGNPAPRKKDYIPKDNDADIVKQAYAKKQQDLEKQINKRQTRGQQKGYTKAEYHDILNS